MPRIAVVAAHSSGRDLHLEPPPEHNLPGEGSGSGGHKMARVVLGLATSRSPMVSVPAPMWSLLGERDQRNRRFKDREGKPVTYGELLERVTPEVAAELTIDVFQA